MVQQNLHIWKARNSSDFAKKFAQMSEIVLFYCIRSALSSGKRHKLERGKLQNAENSHVRIIFTENIRISFRLCVCCSNSVKCFTLKRDFHTYDQDSRVILSALGSMT